MVGAVSYRAPPVLRAVRSRYEKRGYYGQRFWL